MDSKHDLTPLEGVVCSVFADGMGLAAPRDWQADADVCRVQANNPAEMTRPALVQLEFTRDEVTINGKKIPSPDMAVVYCVSAGENPLEGRPAKVVLSFDQVTNPKGIEDSVPNVHAVYLYRTINAEHPFDSIQVKPTGSLYDNLPDGDWKRIVQEVEVRLSDAWNAALQAAGISMKPVEVVPVLSVLANVAETPIRTGLWKEPRVADL